MIPGLSLPALPAPGADSRSLLPYGAVRALPAPPVIQPGRDGDVPRRSRPVDRQTETDGETGTENSTENSTASARRGTAVDRNRPETRQENTASTRRDAGSGTRMHDSAPFVAQVIAQEVMQTGLHIEPWRQATNAYERAASISATAGGRGMFL
jgi:hypothetical protein